MIKHQYDLWLIGAASCDAKMEMAGERPVCKFRMWFSTGKNKKTDKYQEPFFENIKCWGDQAKDIKKGDTVELTGYKTRNEYVNAKGEAKVWDEIVVKTNEKREPMIQFASSGEKPSSKHVTDEAVSQNRAPVIQRKSKSEEDLYINDDDSIPF